MKLNLFLSMLMFNWTKWASSAEVVDGKKKFIKHFVLKKKKLKFGLKTKTQKEILMKIDTSTELALVFVYYSEHTHILMKYFIYRGRKVRLDNWYSSTPPPHNVQIYCPNFW